MSRILEMKKPDLAFAFNPIPLSFQTDQPMEITLKVGEADKPERITLKRNTFLRKGSHTITFDLSAVARSLFDRNEFSVIELQDEALLKNLQVEVYVGNTPVLYDSIFIPVLWGALQIGEKYSQAKRLTAFRGYPFSLPFFQPKDCSTINCIIDSKREFYFMGVCDGKYNFNIDEQIAEAEQSIRFVCSETMEYRSVFDETYDYTFRGFPVDAVLMEVDVKDCLQGKGYYLRWINSQGEWNYYLFHKKTEQTQTNDEGVNLEMYFQSVNFNQNGYHPGTGKSIGKKAQKSLQLYASLVDGETFDFLSQAVQSPVVDLFMGRHPETQQEQWTGIRTQAGTFARSNEHLQDFELSILLPETFTQNL